MANIPYLIGSNQESSGTNSLTVNVATPTTGGDVIHVSINCSAATNSVTSVSDGVNTYTLINSDTTQIGTYEFESTNTPTVALGTSNSFTIHFSGTGGIKAAVVIGIPGVTSGHDVAPATVDAASGTSVSISSGTLSQANEVVLVIASSGAEGVAPTVASPFTLVGQTRLSGGPWLTVGYQVVSSIASVTGTVNWATSVKNCALMTSYKIPAAAPPTGLYLVGEASAAAGGSATLSIPITTETSQGDTITVGAVATAGSVTGVTDTAGNTYSPVPGATETANTGCQLYTFEAYNTDQLTPGGGGLGSLVGSTTTTGLYPTGSTRTQSANVFDSYLGEAWGYSAQKLYFQNSVHGGGGLGRYPTALVDGDNFDVTPLVNAGCQMWLCYQPYIGTNAATIASELAAFQAAVQFWLNNHPNGANGIRVIIYQEPQNSLWAFNSGTAAQNAAAYIQIVRNYAPGIRSLTDPSGNNAKVVYDAAGHAPSEWTTYYPGNAITDEIGVDFYANEWARVVAGGNNDPLAVIRNLALNNGKPFAVTEMGSAIIPSTATNQQVTEYIAYIGDMMAAIPASLRTACMWYNGNRNAPNINTLGYDYLTGTYINNDFRIPLLQAFWQKLTVTPAGSINVTYSGTASAQAAIAVGNQNVQSGNDKAVGATATTGTTVSVATGTLAQAEEDIIAFFADLSAGGQPILGDGLTAASLGIAAGTGGPKLKAGFKAVTTTASDTPSATIVSTTWAISVVTHALNVPVIQGAPGGAYVDQFFSFTATATGGTGALTWSSSGTLTPGLSFTSGGVLSGTPTIAGTYNYTLIVTDSLGLQGTINVNQQVIQLTPPPPPSGPVVVQQAPPTPLPGNILSLADSDAESSTTPYTWTANLNATQPAPSSTAAVTGGNSTGWQAISGGETQIITGLYPAQGDMPYDASCLFLANSNVAATIGIAWFDSTQTLIASVSLGNQLGVTPGNWAPLTFATVSPADTAFAALVADVQGAAAGQAFFVDLAYLTQTSAQILIDWNNPTFQPGGAAGQNFMDVTPFTRQDIGITYMRGRQNFTGEVQAGSASFSLQNDLGTFTRFSTQAVPAIIGGSVALQRRAQINLADETGQFWTRFDGPISEIDYAFDNTGNTSLANITLTDILADLSRESALFCWTKEQVLADGPLFHWTLDDPGNTGGTAPAGAGIYGNAAETSGANGPPMRLLNSDSTKSAQIQWQDTTGGVETLADAVGPSKPDGSEFWSPGTNQPTSLIRGLDSGTVGPYTTPLGSVRFTPAGLSTTPWPAGSQTAQNTFIGTTGYMLQAELPTPLAPTSTGSDYSIECWFTMDPSIGQNLTAKYGPFVPLGLGTSRTKTNLLTGIYLNSGAMNFDCATYSQPPSFLGQNWPSASTPTAVSSVGVPLTADTIQRPHHLVITILGDPSAATVTCWLDGTSIGNFTLPKGQVYDVICVGGAYGGCGAFFGNVSCVSVYGSALSSQQITTHCQLGQYGLWETPSDDVMAQLATYAQVPTFWNSISAQHFGLTMTEYIDITGANALSAMQTIEQAENGLLFVDATGSLNYHTRDWRMGYGPPDLILPQNTFDADMQYQMTDQQMCNEMGVSGPSTLGAAATPVPANSATTSNGQQSFNTVLPFTNNNITSSVLTAGFINSVSQNQYGVYAANPVSSPVALPLISWSRASAQLGIPSLSFWPDPNLIDLASWNANSRSDPFLIPAQLTIDLLTLDPTTGLGISSFYGLEIDNMVAPAAGSLPQSMPNQQGPVEWFIEGVTETYTVTSRTMTLFTSPAAAQRAWIPGDSTYGVPGSTTRIGISQADTSIPQADGKDVSHDAGPPYWPPVFSDTMNNPDSTGNGFVGATDMRGLVNNLQLVLEPPMCIVSQSSQTQSFNNGALSGTSGPPNTAALFWDTVHVDTAGGMGLYPGYPNWYVVTVPGWYELDCSVAWSQTGSGLGGYCGQAWFVVALAAAQALGAGQATPYNVGQYVAPVGEAVRFNSVSMNPICCGTTRMYLGLGDMIAVAAEQNFTSSRGTSTGPVGSHFSIRCTGIGQVDDRTEINSLISSGGTVTLTTHGIVNVKTYANTHTYSYQGSKGFSPNGRRNTDGNCYQGTKGGGLDSEGSQVSQVAFNVAQMQSDLTGHTVKSVTLTCTDTITWYEQGVKLMLGYTTVTPGASTFKPASSSSTVNVLHQFFKENQQLTFTIPNSMFAQFLTGGAKALVLGDNQTTDLNYYGAWNGGPGQWILTVNYK